METTTDTTIENNKLIAEFMGLEYFPKMKAATHNVYGGFDGWIGIDDVWIKTPTKELREHLILDNPDEVGLDFDFKLCEESFYTLKYNTSWDGVMPVIDKIHTLSVSRFNVTIDHCVTIITDNDTDDQIANTSAETSIEATYKAVVEFIKWYNNKD